jgi:hypothetical protein
MIDLLEVEKLFTGNQTGFLQDSLLHKLSKLESNHRPGVINRLGYVGKYQFGAARLERLGYLHKGSYNKFKNKALTIRDNFTGKNGITDLDTFLNSPDLQDLVALESLSMSYVRLSEQGLITPKTSLKKVMSILLCSHIAGTRGAYEYFKHGKDRRDGFGTKVSKYDTFGINVSNKYYNMLYFVTSKNYVIVPDEMSALSILAGLEELSSLLGGVNGFTRKQDL